MAGKLKNVRPTEPRFPQFAREADKPLHFSFFEHQIYNLYGLMVYAIYARSLSLYTNTPTIYNPFQGSVMLV